MTDRNVVISAVKQKLIELGANVADNVVANEKWYDFVLGLLIVPAFLGCNNWAKNSGAPLRSERLTS